ncbi:MAG: ice-binding family protein [Solirubrobacteraceae bacterium]
MLAGSCGLAWAGSASAATASVGLGSAASFSVLAGSTVTNTGLTTMFGSLGLSPGTSVTGAPVVLGQTHVDDAVAIAAKNDLTTAYEEAALLPSSGSAGTDLSGQSFTPGVRTASSSLLLSAGDVTLNAQGDPNAVFVFQIGSTLTTGSNTRVVLVNGAQACNVFWEVGSSATIGAGTSFVGTVMASASITAQTAATIHGRLLAQTGAVTLEANTITNSNCASSGGGSVGGVETTTAEEAAALARETTATALTGSVPAPSPPPTAGSPTAAPTAGSTTAMSPASETNAAATAVAKKKAAKRKAARRKAARRNAAKNRAMQKAAKKRTARRNAALGKGRGRHGPARPALRHKRGAFTG